MLKKHKSKYPYNNNNNPLTGVSKELKYVTNADK